jgi:hypothetical protein
MSAAISSRMTQVCTQDHCFLSPPSSPNEIILTNPNIPNVWEQEMLLKLRSTPVTEQRVPDLKPWKPKSWIENNAKVLYLP